VKPADAVAFASGAGVLFAVALIACYLPGRARRQDQVRPSPSEATDGGHPAGDELRFLGVEADVGAAVERQRPLKDRSLKGLPEVFVQAPIPAGVIRSPGDR
jgi:hypothetical protein